MSNPYHRLLHVHREDSFTASLRDIVQQAHEIIAGTEISHTFLNDEYIEPYERTS